MAVPRTTAGRAGSHAAATDDLLRRYLQGWFPAMLRGGSHQVTYTDAVIGPDAGEGVHGSAIVALETVLEVIDLIRPSKHVNLVFIDSDRRRLEGLAAEIPRRLPPDTRVLPDSIRVRLREGSQGDDLVGVLGEIGALGDPVFAFFDASRGIPFDVLRTLGADSAAEALVTEPAGREKGRQKAFLVTQYRQALLRARFQRSLTFEMVDGDGKALLVAFATRSAKNLQRMKEGMWLVDPAYGIRYRDPRDEQGYLFELRTTPDEGPLRLAVLDLLAEGARTFGELRDHALFETVYPPAPVRDVVRHLLAQGRVTREPEGGPLGPATVLHLAA